MHHTCCTRVESNPVQLRATEIVEDWQRAGTPASYPQTIAAVALLRAYEELIAPKVRDSTADVSNVPALDAATISFHSACIADDA